MIDKILNIYIRNVGRIYLLTMSRYISKLLNRRINGKCRLNFKMFCVNHINMIPF